MTEFSETDLKNLYSLIVQSVSLLERRRGGIFDCDVCIQIVRPLHNGVIFVRKYVCVCIIVYCCCFHALLVRSWYLISNLWLSLVLFSRFCLEYNGGIPWSMQRTSLPLPAITTLQFITRPISCDTRVPYSIPLNKLNCHHQAQQKDNKELLAKNHLGYES